MKRLMTLCIALLLIITMTTPNQGLASAPSESTAPTPMHAVTEYEYEFYIEFDQDLFLDENGDWVETGLNVADFTLSSTSNAHIVRAVAARDMIYLTLSKSILRDEHVTFGMASGVVYSSDTEIRNAAISNFIVETPERALHLKNTMDPSKTKLSIEHIVKYINAISPQNVYGAEGFDRSDMKYLLSLVEGLNVDKYNLMQAIENSEDSLTNPERENLPEQVRSTFSNAITSARDVSNLISPTQRQVDEGVIALRLAQLKFNNYGIRELESDLSNPDIEVGYNTLYVPIGMDVETLKTKLLPSEEVVILYSETNAPVETGTVTSDMKVMLISNPERFYDISIQANVSTMTELNAALANNQVNLIKLLANITDTNAVISIEHEVDFRAEEPYLITVRNIESTAGFSWDYNVNFLKHVSNHDHLLEALGGTTGNIYVNNIDGFTGTLERVDSENQFYRSTDHTRAFVAYSDQFLGALADPEVTNIYIADDIDLNNNVLTFPDRSITLSGPEDPKSKLIAAITNDLLGDSSAVEIINVPTVVSSSWGLDDLGVLLPSESDQAISIEFSSILDETIQLRVNQAIRDGISVGDATYLDFDWHSYNYFFTLDVRNSGEATIEFWSNIYALLSDSPYASYEKLLDPEPFSANIHIDGYGEEITSLRISFNDPVTTSTIQMNKEALIQSLGYYEEDVYYSIPILSIEWEDDNPESPAVLIIHIDPMSDSYYNYYVTFNPDVVRNLEGEVINELYLSPNLD